MDIDEAFARFEREHDDYITTLSGNLEEWKSEARYFKEHCNRKRILNQELNSGFIA